MDVKNVLVTGARGFLGTALVRVLAECGINSRSYDISDGQDILDPDGLRWAMRGMAGCVHLAAQADLEAAEKAPEEAFRLNVDGALRVAEVCAEVGAKYLFASSVCPYGNNGHDVQTEESPLCPTEIYAETKAVAERALKEVAGLDYRIIRPAVYYGPGMRPALAVHRFMTACLSGNAIQVHGDGKQTRCYVHVDDVAGAFATVLQKWPDELVFNVASDEVVSVLELIEIVSRVTGTQPAIQHVADRFGQIYHSHIDCTLLKNHGWRARYPSLEAGLLTCLDEVAEYAGDFA